MESLTVSGTLESLKAVRDYVNLAASECGLDQRRSYRLVLAVDEIATNIVTYGYGGSGASGDITVEANFDGSSLEIILDDRAPPYDPLSVEDPANLDSPLEDRDIGGLGVFLAIRNVDNFRHEYENGHNRTIFVMNSSPS